jgi:hypothetical protein
MATPTRTKKAADLIAGILSWTILAANKRK